MNNIRLKLQRMADESLNKQLIDAVACDDIDTAEKLVNAGADVNCDDEMAVFLSVLNGNTAMRDMLLSHGGQCLDLGLKSKVVANA